MLGLDLRHTPLNAVIKDVWNFWCLIYHYSSLKQSSTILTNFWFRIRLLCVTDSTIAFLEEWQ